MEFANHTTLKQAADAFKIKVMCDLVLQTIYEVYQDYLSDLSIGYPLSGKRNRQIEDLIHVYHLLENVTLTNDEVLSILNYYHEH